MTEDNVDLKTWMDERGLKTKDIAPELHIEEQTLRIWRSQGVPARRLPHVQKFMAEWRAPSASESSPASVVTDEAVMALQELTDGLVLHPTEDQFDAWTAAFKGSSAQNLREWAIRGLNELAGLAPKVVPYEPIHSDHPFWVDGCGGVAAGQQIDAVAHEPIAVSKKYDDDCYALHVFGQSMEPKIPDGSTIIVRRWTEGFPAKGTIVVYSDGMGATLKEFGYRKARMDEERNTFGHVPVLRSLNKSFPDVQTMEGGRIDAVFVEVL